MTKPAACQCAQKFCTEGRCHARTIHRWRGDYDFTGNSLSDFPNYRAALDNGQEAATSMVWRIRYDREDLSWLDWLIDNDLTGTIGAVRNADLGPDVGYDNRGDTFEDIAAMGPVRSGVMMGSNRAGYHYYPSLSMHNVGYFPAFSGTGSYYTDAVNEPVEYPQYAHNVGRPTINYDLPWALDIGCVRCGFSHNAITWPDIEPCWYVPATTAFGGWYKNAEDRVLVRERTRERSHDSDDDEQYHTYWGGDNVDSRHQPPCVPELVMWHHHFTFDPLHGRGSLNDFTPPTTKTAVYRGWARPPASNADSFTHADLDSTDVVVLLGDRRSPSTRENDDPSAAHLAAIVDWLDLGGKTLIITQPGMFTATGEMTSGDPGGLLAGIGSTMSIAAASTSWLSFDFASARLQYWQKTADPLATGLPENYERPHDPVGGQNSGYLVYYIDGGTALLNAVEMAGVPAAPIETRPIIAYETLASGSRVILYGLARQYDAQTSQPKIFTGSAPRIMGSVYTLADNALNGL
jgi:hypothetical protein